MPNKSIFTSFSVFAIAFMARISGLLFVDRRPGDLDQAFLAMGSNFALMGFGMFFGASSDRSILSRNSHFSYQTWIVIFLICLFLSNLFFLFISGKTIYDVRSHYGWLMLYILSLIIGVSGLCGATILTAPASVQIDKHGEEPR